MAVMALATLLLLALTAIGIVIVNTLRRIERELTALRGEHPVPFSVHELAKQKRETEDAAATAKELNDAWIQRWGGKTLHSQEEETELRRQTLEVDHKTKDHNRAVRRYSMMVRANGRTRFGRALMSDEYIGVFDDYSKRSAADLDDYIKRSRAINEGTPA